VRSAGESETSPSTQPFTHHEDLRHFLSALNISRVSLVGHSNYAIALDFTIAYPDLVEKLIYLNLPSILYTRPLILTEMLRNA
jgi:pimeloyl-ACP methyl ester carboxylesterase